MFHAQESQAHFADEPSCCISLGERLLFIIFPVYFGHTSACFYNVGEEDEEDAAPTKRS